MTPDRPPNSSDPDRAATLYLDLLRRCLTRSAFPERWRAYRPKSLFRQTVTRLARSFTKRPLEVVERRPVDPAARAAGTDWPEEALTMMGEKRLLHLEGCVRTVVRDGVPGDLLEAGVWRGGGIILMRGALEALGDRDRTVWAADSFQGLPPPDAERFPADRGLDLHEFPYLAVSLEQVRANVARFGLLDDRVKFLPGWFRDTLPAAPVERLAILRLDGDLYESTWQALDALHPRVSPGGFVVVDDYHRIEPCRRATDEWREAHAIADPIEAIDDDGVFWRRAGGPRP